MKIQIQPAHLLSSTTHQIPGKLLVTELFFSVPLDHAHLDSQSDETHDLRNVRRIKLFCRSVERLEKPIVPESEDDDDEEGTGNGGGKSNGKKAEKKQLPYLVYIQGGPGFGCPPPQNMGGLVDAVLGRGYKLLCFDHRGMGLSTPATAATLALEGSAQQQADYLKLFRADNAIRDLEAIRMCLTANYPATKKKWSIMGNSYGGFTCVAYLSLYPEGLREAFPIAGLAPVTQKKPDEVVRRLMRKTEERNRKYYNKYPEDREKVKKIIKILEDKTTMLPSGGTLSAERFLKMGLHFGFHGGLDNIHDVVLKAANDLNIFGFLTRPTLANIDAMSWFDDHPLYAVIHEPIYAQGTAPNWAFDRVKQEFPLFKITSENDEFFFTGETVFKRDFQDHAELQDLAEVADILAKWDGWPDLYDVEQLKRNEVPVYAATYLDDMYVDFEFAQETASSIKGIKVFITNTLYHDAIRSKCDDVIKAVFALRDDAID